jgi:hypothetical protein
MKKKKTKKAITHSYEDTDGVKIELQKPENDHEAKKMIENE